LNIYQQENIEINQKITQHALAPDGSTGGEKPRRQPRFPHKTAEEKGTIINPDKLSQKVVLGGFTRRR
jgi:hypothetical protein